MAWMLWFFFALPFFWVDGWLARLAVWPMPDLTLAFCLFLSLRARPSALPGLLVFAALGRAVLHQGDAATQILALGVPVALLVPLRAVFVARHVLLQSMAAGFLAVSVAKVSALLARLGDGVVSQPLGAPDLLCAMLLVPPASFVLGRLPPLSAFREGRP